MAIRRSDYCKAERIVDDMYERGDIDSVHEDWCASNDEILIGVQCTSDDLLTMQRRFEEKGIAFH